MTGPAQEDPHCGLLPDHSAEDPEFYLRVGLRAQRHRAVENTGAGWSCGVVLDSVGPGTQTVCSLPGTEMSQPTRRPRNQIAGPTGTAGRHAPPASVDYQALARFRYQLRLF